MILKCKQIYEYFPDWNKTGNVKEDIINYLMNQELPVEMTDDDYVDFMIWHRGLAVPAARNLDDPDVQKGRSLFREIGCASCHRPSWKTGKDNFTDQADSSVTEMHACPDIPIRPFGRIAILYNIVCIWRMISAPAGAAPPVMGTWLICHLHRSQ